MAVTIKLRRGTTSEWSSYNPVLAEGEVGIDLTLDKFKIGDGTTAWNSLGYAAATVAELDLKAPLASPALTGVPTAPTASADTNTTQIATTQYVVGQGYLKSNQSITVSGDASGSGTTSINLTLANSGVSASTYGSSSQIPILAVDAKGRITSASVASVEGLPNQSGNNGKYLTTNGSAASWDTIDLGTDTQGNYVAQVTASGSGISVTGSGESASVTISNTGVTSLTGTANQISVSASNGDATVSFPNSVTFPGTVTLNGNPSQALEAATKQYVDAVSEGLHVHASAQTATTASVNLSNPPAAIDGVTLTNNMRVLVKNQSNTPDNGIYVYNSASAILTRASDFDTPTEISGGDFIFVTGGNTYDNTGWVQTETVTTVGTSPILFTQFSGAGTYTAGIGLQLDGTVFSNTGVLSLAGTANQVSVSASNGNITVSLPSSINVNTTGSAATLTTSRTIELSGDVSGSATFNGSANASITSTLANTAVTPATYGSASAVGTVTVDSKGRITGASNTAIAIAQSAVTNLTTDLAAKANLASPALTGTPTAPTAAVDTNTTQIATTAYVIGQGYLKSATAASTYAPIASPTFTGTVTIPTLSLTQADTATAASHYIVEIASDGLIRPKTLANVQTEIVTTSAVNAAAATTVGTVTSGTWNATNIALNRGGTNASLTAVNGGIVYSTASAFAITSAGTAGQVLTSNGAGAPTWQAAAAGGSAVSEPFSLAGL